MVQLASRLLTVQQLRILVRSRFVRNRRILHQILFGLVV